MKDPVGRRNGALTLAVILALMVPACYPSLRKEASRPEEALTTVRLFYPRIRDDLALDSLILALERNLRYLSKLDPGQPFYYGPHTVRCAQVREGQEALLRFLRERPEPRELEKYLRSHFHILKSVGRTDREKVLFTGYFEPVYDGRLAQDPEFRYPIYKKPDDLVKIDLSLFNDKFRGDSVVARIDGNRVVPYHTREEIDVKKVLSGRGLEIAWLRDPLDVAFLHIQGSGRIRIPEGKPLPVGYQASNGRPYRSIGRYLIEKGLVASEEISMERIRAFLRENPQWLDPVLHSNPSYVFFRVAEDGPLGSMGVPLTAERSLALDDRLFPKGALAFVVCEKPEIDAQGKIARWSPFSRLMVVQDTGGAIKGAGRADLFWGTGAYAETAAGHMKHEGELYILVKK
jgi:membrane-bound lytic murein transglycosylase A